MYVFLVYLSFFCDNELRIFLFWGGWYDNRFSNLVFLWIFKRVNKIWEDYIYVFVEKMCILLELWNLCDKLYLIKW